MPTNSHYLLSSRYTTFSNYLFKQIKCRVVIQRKQNIFIQLAYFPILLR